MKKYKTTHVIKPADLNLHHTLYAGISNEWMTEACFIAACLEHGDIDGVFYKNTHQFTFNKPFKLGEIISYEAVVVRTGKTSVTVHVSMIEELSKEVRGEGYLTFVTVKNGTMEAMIHSVVLDNTSDEDELRWREDVKKFFK